MGFPPLDPDLLFVLTQKVSKKVKTSPASLEKLVVCRLKTFKLVLTKYVNTQTEKFSTPASLHFSAHRTRSVVSEHRKNSLGFKTDTHILLLLKNPKICTKYSKKFYKIAFLT